MTIQEKAAEILSDTETKCVRVGQNKDGSFFVASVRYFRGRVLETQKTYRGEGGWLTTLIREASGYRKVEDLAKCLSDAEYRFDVQGCTLHGDWQTK